MRVVVAVLLAGVLLPGCLSCTEMGCASGLELEAPLSLFDEGEWEFEAAVDGSVERCVVEMPAVEIVEGACSAFDDGQNLVVAFFIVEEDPEVSWAVTGPSGTGGSGVVEPSWSTFAPNGERCGPICASATVEVSW